MPEPAIRSRPGRRTPERAGLVERSGWRYLRDAILEDLPHRPVTGAREPSRPRAVRTWEVMVHVEGLNNRSAWVLTGWKIVEERPVLATLRVAQEGRQDPSGGVHRRPDGT